MGDGKYRLVTDPSEGPKLFQIDTRVTSRGETAVLLTGIDCAERVVCHEAVSFDLAEGEFVFRLGAGNAAAVLDQLLQQGALKINRVFDMGGGRPGPVCVLTPGGSPQPPFGAKSPSPIPDDAGASDGGFFGLQRAAPGGQGPPTPQGPGGAPNAGAGLLAMLQGGGGGAGSPLPLGTPNGVSPSPTAPPPHSTTPTPPRHMMPRTTRGSAGGGPRGRGGVGEVGPEDALFDATGGRSSSSAAQNDHHRSTGTTTGKPPRSPLVANGRSSPSAGAATSALVGGGGGGADLLGILDGARRSPGPTSRPGPPGTDAAGAGAPTSEDLLAMLGGGGARRGAGSGGVGSGGSGAGSSPAPAGALSAAELEARMAGAAGAATPPVGSSQSGGGGGGGGGGSVDLMSMLGRAASRGAEGAEGADSNGGLNVSAIDLSGADGGLGFDVDDDLGELLGGGSSTAAKNKPPPENAPAGGGGDWPVSDGLTHREEERRAQADGEEAELARRVANAVKNGSDRLFEKPNGKKSAFEPGAMATEPLPEDNVGRQLLKKQGWEPLVDPVTGAVVEEAPVPIPGTLPGRAGLGAYDRETARLQAAAAASSADDGVDELVDRQSKLLAMMGIGERKDGVKSSIGKRREGSSSTKASSAAGEDSGDESWAEDEKPRERTKVEHSYSHAELKKLNVNCDAVPAGVDVSVFEEADRRKVEKEKAEAAEKKKREKAEKDAAEKERKEKAKAEREEREKAEKERMESARERVARSKSTDQLDDAPALGGALGLGFLGINSSSNSLASQEDAAKKDDAKEGEKKGMTVRELAAALMAELRGLEDRVEVLGEEEGPMVALKLGAALEAVRQEPFKSI